VCVCVCIKEENICINLQGKGIQHQSCNFSSEKLQWCVVWVWHAVEGSGRKEIWWDDCSFGNEKLHLVTVVFLFITLALVVTCHVIRCTSGLFCRFRAQSSPSGLRLSPPVSLPSHFHHWSFTEVGGRQNSRHYVKVSLRACVAEVFGISGLFVLRPKKELIDQRAPRSRNLSSIFSCVPLLSSGRYMLTRMLAVINFRSYNLTYACPLRREV